MIEKLNNKEYIYRNIQLFYIYSNDKVLKDVLENFIHHILGDIFFNISVDDLNNLLKHRKRWEKLKAKKKYNKKDLEKNWEINMDVKAITNKNTKVFLENEFLFDVLDKTIFILF